MNKLFYVLLPISIILAFIPIDMETQSFLYVIVNTVNASLLVILFALLYSFAKTKDKEPEFSLKETFLFSTLAIYQPLHFWAVNLSEVSFGVGILICLIVYCYFWIVFSLVDLVIKNKNKSLFCGLILSFLSLNFFCDVNFICLISLVILFVILIINLNKIKQGLIVFTSILLIMNLFLWTTNFGKILKSKFKTFDIEGIENYITDKSDKNRDIYIILLDAYSGTDILKQKWGFDNSEFINFLKDEGFYVFDQMYSNYNTTFASVPTILGLDYYNPQKYDNSSEALNDALIFKIAKFNDYITFYKKYGDFTVNSRYVDYVTESKVISYSSIIICKFFQNSLFSNVFDYLFKIIYLNPNKIFTYTEFEINDKKFVFTHILAPHPPYLYDENGEMQPTVNFENIDNGYLPYLKYVNNQTIDYIKQLKQKNIKNPPVIIITGDHGLRDDNVFNSHFSTFTAYYNPEQQYEHVKNSKTLLNFFINFSNYELNSKIPNIKDEMRFMELYINGLGLDEFNLNERLKDANDVTKRYLK